MRSVAAYSLEKRVLGKSNIAVSAIGLGLWGIGGASVGPSLGPTDDKESLATIEAAFEAGVNFFDTADTYGNGRSEELLGQVMRGRRDKFVVATKIGSVYPNTFIEVGAHIDTQPTTPGAGDNASGSTATIWSAVSPSLVIAGP